MGLTITGHDVAEASARILSSTAVFALLDEAELTPKPALVDGRGRGAHHDLDLPRLRRSARSLRDGFAAMARAASGEPPSLRLREALGRIGRDMEASMLKATAGSNAHRGAIWALGLLVAAAAQRWSETPFGKTIVAADVALVAGALARLPDQFATRARSHGQEVRTRFGATGARGEAQAGFPHAILAGLPTLKAARRRGAPETCARLDALMAIMASLEDTCLLHRGGHIALAAAQTGARAVLAAGGTAEHTGLAHLHRLHTALMELWASPGGSGDLLAVTLFLDRLEHEPAGVQSTLPSTFQEASLGDTDLRI